MIVFWGLDQDQCIRCVVSRERWTIISMETIGTSSKCREDRPAIEEVAQRKYLTGRGEEDGSILIRTADIPY